MNTNEKLRNFREAAGETQATLSKKLGLAQSQFNQFEMGTRGVSVIMADKYLDWVAKVGDAIPKAQWPTLKDLVKLAKKAKKNR